MLECAYDAICHLVTDLNYVAQLQASLLLQIARKVPAPSHFAGSTVQEYRRHAKHVAKHTHSPGQDKVRLRVRRLVILRQVRLCYEDNEVRDLDQPECDLTCKPVIEVRKCRLVAFGLELRNEDC